MTMSAFSLIVRGVVFVEQGSPKSLISAVQYPHCRMDQGPGLGAMFDYYKRQKKIPDNHRQPTLFCGR